MRLSYIMAYFKIKRKFLLRFIMTAIFCLFALWLLSLIKPSRRLLLTMQLRAPAEKLRSFLEEHAGGKGEINYLVKSSDSLCRGELEKYFSKQERWKLVGDEDGGGGEGGFYLISCRVEKEKIFLLARTFGRIRGNEKFGSIRIEEKLANYTSLIPPVIAIIIAFGLREVRFALGFAIYIGALLYGGMDLTFGLWTAFRRYIMETVTDQFSFTIILFTLSMVGMVRISARSGGNRGIADFIGRIASSARTSKVATALLGVGIFFDDYSNTVVVGTTMKNLTDRFRVSREKLAYIVDSTSAPVAGIALISTWIGYEISLFQSLSDSLHLGISGYGMFLKIVPIRFYCYAAIAFVFLTSIANRDFGPMFRAEKRAFSTGRLFADGSNLMLSSFTTGMEFPRSIKPHWSSAGIPVLVVVVFTFFGMIAGGSGEPGPQNWAKENGFFNLTFVRLCFESADGGFVLLVSSLAGSWAAVIMALFKRYYPSGVKKTTPLTEILLPVPASFTTAIVIASVHRGYFANGTTMLDLRWWSELFKSDETIKLLLIFLTAGILSTVIIVFRCGIKITGKGISASRSIPVTFVDSARAWLNGTRALSYAVTILIIAWGIRRVCEDLHTSAFIVASFGQHIKPWMIPAAVFLISSITSFCTGTSWGTMGILIPTLLPFAYYIGGEEILLLSTGSVLDGAIFGDHCSPVSDTTILSSTFSSCDHMDHVKTQIPYALLCAAVALIVGYLPIGEKIPLTVIYATGLLILTVFLFIVGKKVAVGKLPV